MIYTMINMKKILLPFLLSLIFQLSSHSQCAGPIGFQLSVPPDENGNYPPNTEVELCVWMNGWLGNDLIKIGSKVLD